MGKDMEQVSSKKSEDRRDYGEERERPNSEGRV